MKRPPDPDFRMNCRHQIYEEEPAKAKFYQDIFDLTLNETVTFIFIPEMDHTNEWPPDLARVNDDTVQGARKLSMVLGRYIVTPHSKPGLECELLRLNPDFECIIFYLPLDDFKAIMREVRALGEEYSGAHSYKKSSAVKAPRLLEF